MDNRAGGGSDHRKIVFVGGIDDTIDETLLHAAFTPFGDIVSVYLPRGTVKNPSNEKDIEGQTKGNTDTDKIQEENGNPTNTSNTTTTMFNSGINSGVKGYAFVTFTEEEYASAAVDNMEGSELLGRVLTVNLAKPMKHKLGNSKAVWSTEQYLLENAQNEELELALAEEEEFGEEDG